MTRLMVAASRSDEHGTLQQTHGKDGTKKFPSRVEHNHRPVLSGADGWETVALPPE